MNLVEPDAHVEHAAVDEGGWPLAIAFAVIGPLAIVLAVVMVAIALA
jgi:hypothetical protein